MPSLNQFNVSLWGDEAFSAILSMKPVTQIISIITRDTSPPLFNILEHYWFKFAGSSEISIRTLVFIFYLIAVLFTYKIGSYLWDKKTGFLAAVLTFLNPFFFAYAFEGRMYSLLAAATTASFYFFIKKNWVGYVITTTLALYSHHFAIFALFVQGLWFLKTLGTGQWALGTRMFKAFIAIAVLYSPWIIPLYNQTKMVGGGFWLGRPTFKDLGFIFLKYLNVSMLLLLLRNWTKNWNKSAILLAWFLVPILATWLVSQKFQSIFYDRYLLYTIPPAMLLAASQRTILSKIALFIVIAIFVSADIYYFTHPFKRPFRELAEYVKEVKRGDDLLLNWNAASHHLWESKYYGIPAALYIAGEGELPFYVGTALMTEGDVIRSLPEGRAARGVNRVGVITSGDMNDVALLGYAKEEFKTFGDLKFIWFRRIR